MHFSSKSFEVEASRAYATYSIGAHFRGKVTDEAENNLPKERQKNTN